MGRYEKPSVDKTIAAKMFGDARLSCMRNREIKKKEKKQNLLTLKRATLPLIETDFLRTKDTNCIQCNRSKETYGLSFEWHLEPIDVLGEKSFSGLGKHRMFSIMTNGIIVQPAKIEMLKYLRDNKSEVPIIYVLKSRDRTFDEMLLTFILDTYDMKIAQSTNGMDEISIGKHLKSNENLIVHIDDELELSSILKGVDYGETKEIYLLSVSIEYEIQHKDPFTVPKLNFLPKFFYKNYGRVKVNFNEPYTCRQLRQCIQTAEATEDFIYEVIEGHLQHDIAFKRPVFATNIVAYLLLTYFRTIGGTVEDIAQRVDEIRKSTSIDFSFDGDSIDVVKYALTKLKDKVIINENLIIQPLEKSSILSELQDYAATLICHFALQSILILSAEHLKRTDIYIDYYKMLDLAIDFCEILQYEIPFYKPCTTFHDQLSNAFGLLSRKDMIIRNVTTYTENEKRAQRIAEYFDDLNNSDDSDEYDEDEFNPENEVLINGDMQKELDFLKNVTLPIQETYMNTAYVLKRFIGKQLIPHDYFIDLAMSAMIDECIAGNCKFWESCSTKWIKNSLKLMLMWGVIAKIENTDGHYMIKDFYDNEDGIHRIAKHIEQFSDY